MPVSAVVQSDQLEMGSILSRVADICEMAGSRDLVGPVGLLIMTVVPCDRVALCQLDEAPCFAPQRAWLSGASTLLGARGPQRLSLLTSSDQREARGWLLVRDTSEFDSADLERGIELLPLLMVLDRLARHPAPVAVPIPEVTLTAREQSVLALIAQGLTANAAARRLGVAPSTVRKHLEHAYAKLGYHDRLAAVVYAQHHGLLPQPSTAHS
jgi:DNA-binding CsgD family transcriptional regulator